MPPRGGVAACGTDIVMAALPGGVSSSPGASGEEGLTMTSDVPGIGSNAAT
ncbi:MAG: tryptophan--tRNA ligase, partial [Actinomycetota bacterium]